jgi:hypothetical protein
MFADTCADLDSEKCPVAKRTRELREERERQARKDREAREQQRQAANISQDWWAAIDQRIHGYVLQNCSKGGWLTEGIGQALGAIKEQLRKEFRTAIDGLRGEVGNADDKLRDELRGELDRLHVVDQERRELERALNQTNLDAGNARIAGAIEAATVKLRSEFDVEKLREEFRVGISRLPIAKVWDPDEVCHRGDVVVHDGAVFQALQDTGKTPTADHPHWILLARAGRDGLDGRTPKLRGVFEAYQQYRQFDIVTCDGNCYIAYRDNPGLPGHDDSAWQLLAKGSRGPSGDVGPRGRKGERGARGEAAPTIVSWVLDRARYTAVPTMSDGTQGAVLDLRGLFEQFQQEAL